MMLVKRWSDFDNAETMAEEVQSAVSLSSCGAAVTVAEKKKLKNYIRDVGIILFVLHKKNFQNMKIQITY